MEITGWFNIYLIPEYKGMLSTWKFANTILSGSDISLVIKWKKWLGISEFLNHCVDQSLLSWKSSKLKNFQKFMISVVIISFWIIFNWLTLMTRWLHWKTHGVFRYFWSIYAQNIMLFYLSLSEMFKFEKSRVFKLLFFATLVSLTFFDTNRPTNHTKLNHSANER